MSNSSQLCSSFFMPFNLTLTMSLCENTVKWMSSSGSHSQARAVQGWVTFQVEGQPGGEELQSYACSGLGSGGMLG